MDPSGRFEYERACSDGGMALLYRGDLKLRRRHEASVRQGKHINDQRIGGSYPFARSLLERNVCWDCAL